MLQNYMPLLSFHPFHRRNWTGYIVVFPDFCVISEPSLSNSKSGCCNKKTVDSWELSEGSAIGLVIEEGFIPVEKGGERLLWDGF